MAQQARELRVAWDLSQMIAGRELAMAFGCTLTISRLGSVINFNLTTLIFNSIFGMLSSKPEYHVFCAPNSTANPWLDGTDATIDVNGTVTLAPSVVAACRNSLAATFWFGDGLILLSFGAAVFWALPFVDVSRDVLHRLTILRLGRLLTVLNQVDRFRLICECVAKIVPASTGVVGVLFCAGAFWAGAGVQLFGGLVYDGNGALEGSDYLDSHYDVLNFNDFAMGFLPLFAMVTSGGPYTEFVEALNDVSGARGAGYYFFVSFYVVGVLIFFNVFSAFVIDAFLSQYTEARALAHDDEADTLDQSCVEEGYRIVATRRSAQNDVYRAMFLEDDDGDDDDDDECGVIN